MMHSTVTLRSVKWMDDMIWGALRKSGHGLLKIQLSCHLPGGTIENHNESQSEQPASQMRLTETQSKHLPNMSLKHYYYANPLSNKNVNFSGWQELTIKLNDIFFPLVAPTHESLLPLWSIGLSFLSFLIKDSQ
jgi:hypothetical protein